MILGQIVAQLQVEVAAGGSINIQIIPNGTLGSEADMISQIQAGALDMAKVSASTLGNFSEKYNAFSVPYVFNDQAHYYSYMDSDSAKAVFESTDDQGFRGLTWLDSGARSFYTKATAIRTPADLKGLKIRTMDSQMAIDMMNCLGGSATVMGYSDIYTGMQQGVIDGLEGNMNAYSTNGSSEVCKNMSLTNHLVGTCGAYISTKVWNSIPEEYRTIIQEEFTKGAKELTDFTNASFAETKAKLEKEQGCSFNEVDVDAFRAAVQPEFERMVKEDGVTPTFYEQAQAILAVQKANADAIRLLNEAMPTDKVLALRSLEALAKVANGKATKIIIPSDLQNLGGVVPSIKELMTDPKDAE